MTSSEMPLPCGIGTGVSLMGPLPPVDPLRSPVAGSRRVGLVRMPLAVQRDPHASVRTRLRLPLQNLHDWFSPPVSEGQWKRSRSSCPQGAAVYIQVPTGASSHGLANYSLSEPVHFPAPAGTDIAGSSGASAAHPPGSITASPCVPQRSCDWWMPSRKKVRSGTVGDNGAFTLIPDLWHKHGDTVWAR